MVCSYSTRVLLYALANSLPQLIIPNFGAHFSLLIPMMQPVFTGIQAST